MLLMVADQKHRIEDAHELLLEGLRSRQSCECSITLCDELVHDLVNMRSFLHSLEEAKINLRHVCYPTCSSPFGFSNTHLSIAPIQHIPCQHQHVDMYCLLWAQAPLSCYTLTVSLK